MPDLLLADLRLGALRNVRLTHPARPADRWRLVEGQPFVIRPGSLDLVPIAAAALPPSLAIDCTDEQNAVEIDTAIMRAIYANGVPPQPKVHAARLIIYRADFGFAEIRDDEAGCGHWSGRAFEVLAGLRPIEENLPEARRRLALLVIGKEPS